MSRTRRRQRRKKKATVVVAPPSLPGGKKPKMCLNMIVRDEEHILRETLESVTPYIDYYVISDTGSVDRTADIIETYFREQGIPGELYHDTWKDFGHNRTLAMKEAKGKSEYLWVMDADDLVVGEFQFPASMTKDAYLLRYGTGFSYMRMQVFKNDGTLDWRYVGILHEYPACANKNPLDREEIKGTYYIDSRRLGARSKDPKKYLKDAKTLETALETEPKNERYMFYCAQSYRDYGDKENALRWYKKRVEAGGWVEEVWYSMLQVGTLLLAQKEEKEGKEWMYKCIQLLSDRAEPWIALANHHRNKGDHELTYLYACKAKTIPHPGSKYLLFMMEPDYTYNPHFEISISAYYIGLRSEGKEACETLLKMDLPEPMKNLTLSNLKFYT